MDVKNSNSEQNTPQKWFNVKEAAKYLGVSQPTIFRWMKDGSLTFYKVGASTRFSQESLDAVIEKNTGSKEARRVIGKCLACGHNFLVEGRVQGAGKLYFKPKKTQFWTLHESMVSTSARACCACGHIQFYADTDKLCKLKPEKVQSDEVKSVL